MARPRPRGPRLAGQSAPNSWEITSVDGRTTRFGPAELAALPQVSAEVSEGGLASTFAGPALRDLLTLAGAPGGRSLRGTAMALVVLGSGTAARSSPLVQMPSAAAPGPHR
ncbi:MAG: hypothetical protein AB7T31_08885 [Gemmatimonadales bacterium]